MKMKKRMLCENNRYIKPSNIQLINIKLNKTHEFLLTNSDDRIRS